MSKRVLAVQVLLHLSFVIATPWIVHTFQVVAEVARSQHITNLDRHASMENLKELQKYSEKLQFEATCCRRWANEIQNQIMDEQEKVQTWISGMTDELIRLKKIQPAWIHQLQTQGGPPAPPTCMAASSIQQHQPASSSAASTITVKPAPMSSNRPWHLHLRMLHFRQEWVQIYGLKQ